MPIARIPKEPQEFLDRVRGVAQGAIDTTRERTLPEDSVFQRALPDVMQLAADLAIPKDVTDLLLGAVMPRGPRHVLPGNPFARRITGTGPKPKSSKWIPVGKRAPILRVTDFKSAVPETLPDKATLAEAVRIMNRFHAGPKDKKTRVDLIKWALGSPSVYRKQRAMADVETRAGRSGLAAKRKFLDKQLQEVRQALAVGGLEIPAFDDVVSNPMPRGIRAGGPRTTHFGPRPWEK